MKHAVIKVQFVLLPVLEFSIVKYFYLRQINL